jgi:hypothetical protein
MSCQPLSFGTSQASTCRIPDNIIGMNVKDVQAVLSSTGKLVQVVRIGDRITKEINRDRLRVAIDADDKVRAFYFG